MSHRNIMISLWPIVLRTFQWTSSLIVLKLINTLVNHWVIFTELSPPSLWEIFLVIDIAIRHSYGCITFVLMFKGIMRYTKTNIVSRQELIIQNIATDQIKSIKIMADTMSFLTKISLVINYLQCIFSDYTKYVKWTTESRNVSQRLDSLNPGRCGDLKCVNFKIKQGDGYLEYWSQYCRKMNAGDLINTLRLRQNGRYIADDTFKQVFMNENVRISMNISLKFVPKGLINNIPALVQIMAWRRPGDKPLSEPMFAYMRHSASMS